MLLIAAIAGAAWAAVKFFNAARNSDPEAAEEGVRHIRQSTGVVLAIGRAISAVLDALQMISRPASVPAGAGTTITPRFGQRVADMVDAGP